MDAVVGTGATIVDTRKTTPGLRLLEKRAVRAGGGQNHRMGLFDAVLIKDNHVQSVGPPGATVRRARSHVGDTVKVEVEIDDLAYLESVIEAGADIVLLDNMSYDQIREAIELIDGRSETEASGGVTLETVREIAGTGVNFISVGALTHSAPSVDIALDFDQIA